MDKGPGQERTSWATEGNIWLGLVGAGVEVGEGPDGLSLQ